MRQTVLLFTENKGRPSVVHRLYVKDVHSHWLNIYCPEASIGTFWPCWCLGCGYFNYEVATSQSVEHGPQVGREGTPGNFCEIFTL